MFILNKDCNDVYNTDHIVNIYRDECTIKVCAGTATRGGVLGKYNNIDILNVDVISAANFELVFYGPIQKPTVTIGKHKYGLNVDLATGEYATVNSLKKKIKKYDQYGHEENIYHTRNRDSEIFEKLPAGTLQVLKSNELAFDITIYDERGEPVWI